MDDERRTSPKPRWRLDSALEAKSAIHHLREDASVIIPRPGEVYRLGKEGVTLAKN